MVALTRKFKKIFAKDSANNGVFGSAAALSPATSTNPETIESLAAFLTGWEDAAEGGLKLPTLEDMQGLKYDTDYHLAYIYQTGMQVYDSQTTYYTNDLVRKAATTEIWKSLVDDNTSNALVEGANWTLVGNLANIPTSPIVDASTTAKGIVELLTNAELAAGTDTTRAATAAAIASLFGTSLRSTNGYARLPVKVGGAFVEIIIQWGIRSSLAQGTGADVNLPITYPNAHLSALSTISRFGDLAGSSYAFALSTSQIRVFNNTNSASSQDIAWFSIGY